MRPASDNGFASKLQVIFGGLALALVMLGGFYAAVYNPLTARLDRNEEALETRLPKMQFSEVVKRVDESLERIDATLLRMQDGIVTRGEHVQQWTVRDNAIADLRAQIKDIKDDVKSIHPTTKVFDDILRRMERLESARRVEPGTNAPLVPRS